MVQMIISIALFLLLIVNSTVLLLIPIDVYVTGFGKIGLNAANNFFQYPRVKPYGSIFFEKIFMAEMDRHQLALAYDAVV